MLAAFTPGAQDTWHTDQLAFNEDELQALSTMLSGISYCKPYSALRNLIAQNVRRRIITAPLDDIAHHNVAQFCLQYGRRTRYVQSQRSNSSEGRETTFRIRDKDIVHARQDADGGDGRG